MPQDIQLQLQPTASELKMPDAYTVLANATKAALDGDTKRASELVRMARKLATPEQADNINWLSGSVMMDISWVMAGLHPREPNPHNEFGTVHFWFRENFGQIIPNGKLVKVQPRPRALPDFMVQIGEELCPVECKLKFNARALNQLTSYLKAYDASHGYAVALELSCALPDHITFITYPMEARHA